jgi:hypothetical protein
LRHRRDVALRGGVHESDGRLEGERGARGGAAEVNERGGQADGAMAAGVEEAHVVEEDHAAGRGGIGGGHDQRADERVEAARFVDDGGAEPVEALAEDAGLRRDGARTKVGSARDDDAGGFALGVGIDDVDGVHRAGSRAGEGEAAGGLSASSNRQEVTNSRPGACRVSKARIISTGMELPLMMASWKSRSVMRPEPTSSLCKARNCRPPTM